MKILYGIPMLVLIVLGNAVLVSPAEARQPVGCGDCTEEYPCATVFEFKDVKFVHNVFCTVDEEGREVWDSGDEEKFDMFYFETPRSDRTKKELDI